MRRGLERAAATRVFNHLIISGLERAADDYILACTETFRRIFLFKNFRLLNSSVWLLSTSQEYSAYTPLLKEVPRMRGGCKKVPLGFSVSILIDAYLFTTATWIKWEIFRLVYELNGLGNADLVFLGFVARLSP